MLWSFSLRILMFSLLITHGKAYFMDEHKNSLLRQHPDIRVWNAGSGCVAHKTGCSHIQHVCRSDIFVLIHDAFHFNRKISLARMCKYNLILFSRNLVNRVFPLQFKMDPQENAPLKQSRGLGTDIAIISSMVFVGQLIVSLSMGSLITALGSTSATLYAASGAGILAALSALNVLYLD